MIFINGVHSGYRGSNGLRFILPYSCTPGTVDFVVCLPLLTIFHYLGQVHSPLFADVALAIE